MTNKTKAFYWATILSACTMGETAGDFFSERFSKKIFSKQIEHVITAEHPHLDKKQTTTSLPPTDAFYWAAILVASTFGTTMGDFVSDVLKLGFGGGSLFLGALLAVVLVFEFRAKTSNKPRYWTALVITSTIGATTGDFLTKQDGLNLGYAFGSSLLIAVFAIIFFIGRRLKHS